MKKIEHICNICNKKFNTAISMTNHRRWHNLPEYKKFQTNFKNKTNRGLDESKIIDLYVKENKSINEIYKMFNCGNTTIKNILKPKSFSNGWKSTQNSN